MLVLTRKVGEQLLIGDEVVVTVLEVRGDGIKIGIDAPRDVKVQRREVLLTVSETNLQAARAASPEAETALKALFGASNGESAPNDDAASAADPEAGREPSPGAPAGDDQRSGPAGPDHTNPAPRS
ncbi:carbon storage regulator CsrA [Nesterenkonia sandarakina]|uniref:Translational regulator CsrA n=1 Tax=Nesterenkonia sandarakina TaxID=272918 RepID=A0A7Z0J3L9_9MICC|nr:carbon storage regulator [Nesterenkonia sandarakina]